MNSGEQYLIVLVKLENRERWKSATRLQKDILAVIDLVNVAHDITGISTSGLHVDYWKGTPLVSFFVACDDRYGDREATDEMIFATFAKAIDVCGYRNDMRVLTPVERRTLGAG